jgi:hypothetical protein
VKYYPDAENIEFGIFENLILDTFILETILYYSIGHSNTRKIYKSLKLRVSF